MKLIEFPNEKKYTTTLAGRTLVVETGKMAGLANGSCLVRYGDTVVLVTATASKSPREGIDFFPLSVDFEERLYSVGRIPGSFMRREGRPSEKAILASRLIDRPIRPLFPKDMRNDVAIAATVMSIENDNLPEIVAMIGASVALSISDIPWGGPIAGVVVGYVDGKYVINPTSAEREKSQMHVTVAGTKDKIAMIEAGADQIPEDVMLGGILAAHEEIKKLAAFIETIKNEIGLAKSSYQSSEVSQEIYEDIKAYALDHMKECLDTDDKKIRDERLEVLSADITEHFAEKYPDSSKAFGECLYKLQKYVVRRWLLDEGKRVDGRSLDDVRPLGSEVGVLPRTHGSGIFTRGQTQVLTVVTLGTMRDSQELDTIYEEENKRYMHHYNFPSYSVGEARPTRSPGRREIGHGALAERALEPVIPSVEEFPYSLRLVSEVLSSNGSTSQGSVCGSTLALMDAGVPIKAPVAGISCGLVTEGDRYITFTDIQGLEDFFGDMDFKVAGTKKGITAIQVDIKIDGLTPEIIKDAFERTRVARYQILDDVMLKCIPAPRAELSAYAPKMIRIMIDPDKIREVIGKGGSVIQKITADTNTKIDIEDDGSVCIAAINQEDGERARKIIEAITKDPKIGDIFEGKVTRIMTFGAFVEFAPGKEGMIHISKLENHRVAKVEDVLKVGDTTWVKIIEIDEKGRINLSRKDAMEEIAAKKSPQE
ncbi:MAG: polyribonucleotide nucleotidyltransferase [Clostridiales bacterium]|nr:polyribonucleotide nucleotidyltransferase [Clostridiales bacterium]